MTDQTFLNIATPCHEDWNRMTAAQQGRHCQSCCKTVVDFTAMSDVEVLQVLTKAAGKTCGRFTDEQLQRPLQPKVAVTSKKYKFFLSAFIPTFLLAHFGMAQSQFTDNKPDSLKIKNDIKLVKDKTAAKPVIKTLVSNKKSDFEALKIPINTSIEQKVLRLGEVTMERIKPAGDSTSITAR